ncbi:zinc finger protein CONSTANS-LIKE 16-like [Vicia villosa]|uniref:zinc finger protein CONSTANS-LIKE 16-like n=1 Tax=Vicia villosa TaxID=3911 RepID=UPI00273AF9EF|nr:zinc finger protein CONSTANS-LIKE 16-like [Vicia villosa]
MTCSSETVAKAVGGKTARACDSCITKRARWYCAADDAFLCQGCDSSVHSANSLARRHERVRLKTASYKSAGGDNNGSINSGPFSGFTKKARTPRQGKQKNNANVNVDVNVNNPFHLVPELGFDEVHSGSNEENEEQLLYRVPIFDPFVGELCTSSPSVGSTEGGLGAVVPGVSAFASDRSERMVQLGGDSNYEMGLLPSDIELAEFAADVESLLGRGLDNECMGMEELGLIDAKHEDEEWECSGKVKEEGEEIREVVEGDSNIIDIGKESSFELNFDYETCEEVKEKVGLDIEQNENCNKGKRKMSLQLDYDAVIIAWDGQKCPWTNGDKPNLDVDEIWPDCMGIYGTEVQYPYGELGGYGCNPVMVDGGREARVSRYREKRRTRLFSKKIRYEVRKLNAEKRPRMKGRFVKRTSFAVPTFPLLK